MRSLVFSVVITLAITAKANAHGQVWLSVTGNSPDLNGWIFNHGAPGQAITCDCSAFSGSQYIDVAVHYDLADSGARGWALDFYSYGAGPLTNITNLSVLSQGFSVGIQAGSVPNSNGVLAYDQAGLDLSAFGTGPGSFVLETFRVNFIGNLSSVYSGIGSVEFGGNDPDDGLGGFYEVVQIGPNEPRAGYSLGGGLPSSAEKYPVIWNLGPEPASLTILLIALPFITNRNRK